MVRSERPHHQHAGIQPRTASAKREERTGQFPRHLPCAHTDHTAGTNHIHSTQDRAVCPHHARISYLFNRAIPTYSRAGRLEARLAQCHHLQQQHQHAAKRHQPFISQSGYRCAQGADRSTRHIYRPRDVHMGRPMAFRLELCPRTVR